MLDAGREYAPPGCFRGTPATDLEFFNACTSAAFVSFDNCRVTGGCDGGALAPLVKAPPATPVTSSPIDGGTTVTCYDAVERPNVIFMNGELCGVLANARHRADRRAGCDSRRG